MKRILIALSLLVSNLWALSVNATLVGTTPGEFAVSPSGAATYSVPIELPPTVGGVKPSLALTYNSQAGNGIAGVGWGLSGLSSITRCPTTLAQDGFIDGVDYDHLDKFCMDGQRLISVNGAYGSSGTEYRTEIDSFSKITSYGGNIITGPTSFTVWTKSGEKIDYSRAKHKNVSTGYVSWVMTKLSDSVGNYFEVGYSVTANPVYIRFYSSDGTQNIHTVNFTYDPRPDLSSGYISGTQYTSQERLKNISVLKNGNSVRSYDVGYQYGSPSRVSFIQKCLGVNCLKKDFNYEDKGANGFGARSLREAQFGLNQGWDNKLHPRMMADVNGDGFEDIVGFAAGGVSVSFSNGSDFGPRTALISDYGTGHGWNHEKHLRVMADVNGDGKKDIVGFSDGGVNVSFSIGNGFTPRALYLEDFGYGHGWRINDHQRLLVDVNADGRQDIVGFANGGVKVALSKGNGFEDASLWIADYGYDQGWRIDKNPRMMADVNGDGLLDIIGFSDGGVQVSYSTGTSFTPRVGLLSDYGYGQGWRIDKHPRMMADVNGDGLQDIVGISDGGVNISFSTGVGFTPRALYLADFGYGHGWRDEFHLRMMADMNGDGMQDLVGFSHGGLNVALSTGTGFKPRALWLGDYGYNQGWRIDKHPRMLSDANGDGILDIVGIAAGGITSAYSNAKHQLKLKTVVERGITEVTFNYSKLNDPAIHLKTNTSYPNVSFSNATPVVKSVVNSLGLSTSYSYEGNTINLRGRGGLGFTKVTITNHATNTVSITEYNHNFPYIGMPNNSRITVNGKLISDSQSTHIHRIGGSLYDHFPTAWNYPGTSEGSIKANSIFVYTKLSVEKKYSYDKGSALSQTVTGGMTFDHFGNLLTTTVTSGLPGIELSRVVTTNTYDNDAFYWQLGRLRTASVTHTPAVGAPITKESSFSYYGVGNPHAGLLKTETIEPNKPEHTLTTSYEYDQYGNRIKVTVSGTNKTFNVDGSETSTIPFNHVTTTEYAAGPNNSHPAGLFPTKVTNAKGHSETRTYDPLYGNVLSTTGPNGITTTFEYDALGRKTKTIPAVGKPSLTNYAWCTAGGDCPDANGYTITKSVEGIDGYSKVYFDRFGRETRKVSNDRNGTLSNNLIYVDTEYDSLGRVKKVYEPYNMDKPKDKFTETFYDAAGRVKKVTRPDGLAPPETVYNGFTTTTYDVLGRPTVTTKNALGQTELIKDPAGGTVKYQYDAVGNLEKTTTCESNGINNCVVIDLKYDLRGNKTKMIDPDMGTWHYRYNTLGELVWQKDAKGQIITMAYDKLGRMVSRTEAEGTSTWQYDTATKGIGKLHKAFGYGNTLFKELSYDNYGRPLQTTTHIDGQSYTSTSSYDDTFGRLDTLTYPTGFKLKYNYASTGSLNSVVNADSLSTYYWRAGTVCSNKPGVLCSQFLGDRSTQVNGFTGIEVSSTYHDTNPWLIAQTANQQDNILNTYQHFDYSYDIVGNLMSRSQNAYSVGGNSNAKHETFTYDSFLDRVTGATTNGVVSGAYQYDGLGNIISKNDVGTYTYGQPANSCSVNWAGPHAVTQTTLNNVVTNYCYDQNGNLTQGNGRTVTWNSFNKPLRMEQNNKWAEFSYGPNRSRYKKRNSDLVTTHYVGMGGKGNVLYEREMTTNGVTVNRNHIYVGGKRIAVKLEYSNANPLDPEVVHYMLGDHLGSVTTIVNQDGQVVRRKSFDVWGKERNADTWSGAAAIDTDNHRGYTGHESIQEVGLVHMNGRIYDPALARFMSSDPHIQSAGSSQSYNRYSYVWNNPLANTDPSGYFLKKLGRELRRFGKRVDREVRRSGGWGAWVGNPSANFQHQQHKYAVHNVPYYSQVATIGVAIFGTPALAAAMQGYTTRTMGASLSDSFKAALVSYVSGKSFEYIGDAYKGVEGFSSGKLLAHGAVGGLSSVANGGDFWSGFASAGVTQGFNQVGLFKGIQSRLGHGIAGAVVGGTASVVSGGKFANGAITGAFSHMFNDYKHELKVKSIANAYRKAGFSFSQNEARAALRTAMSSDPRALALIENSKVLSIDQMQLALETAVVMSMSGESIELLGETGFKHSKGAAWLIKNAAGHDFDLRDIRENIEDGYSSFGFGMGARRAGLLYIARPLGGGKFHREFDPNYVRW